MKKKSNLVFKVIEGTKSCNGGRHKWSLPSRGKPGKWHSIKRGLTVDLCAVGFHVTRKPAIWLGYGRTVYVAETAGKTDGPRKDGSSDSTKYAAQSCRLIRKATMADLAGLGVIIGKGVINLKSGEKLTFPHYGPEFTSSCKVVFKDGKFTIHGPGKVQMQSDQEYVNVNYMGS